MQFTPDDVTLLDVIEKPYDINGNSGISRKLRFLANGQVYLAKIPEHLMTEARNLLDDNPIQSVNLVLTSPREQLSLAVDSFN